MNQSVFFFLRGIFLLTIYLFSLVPDAEGQTWKRNRKEVYYGLGATNFLGELGGANQIGTDFVKDLEIVMTRPAGIIGMRYNIEANMKLRGSLTIGMLSGNDNLTQEQFRNNRNLHFRTPIIELSGMYEYYFNNEQAGHRYNIKGAKGMRSKNISYFLFAGAGVIYFNPKALYNGGWQSLQPLGTEGQGIKPGTKKYSRISLAIPVGGGLLYGINRKWKIGLELGVRKTFTDYIDDVSTEYYDNSVIRAQNGNMAADLADPNKGAFTYHFDDAGKTRQGLQRGDATDKDSYLIALFTVHYKLQRRGSRAKF